MERQKGFLQFVMFSIGEKKRKSFKPGLFQSCFIGFFTYSAFAVKGNPQILLAEPVYSNKINPAESANEHLTVTATAKSSFIPHTECNYRIYSDFLEIWVSQGCRKESRS